VVRVRDDIEWDRGATGATLSQVRGLDEESHIDEFGADAREGRWRQLEAASELGARKRAVQEHLKRYSLGEVISGYPRHTASRSFLW